MATDPPAPDLGATRRVTYVCGHAAEIPTDIHPSQAAPCPTCHPPAPDLGAIRARLPAIRNTLNYTLSDKRRLAAVREDHLAETLDLADALLAAYDAQTARLAAVEAERDHAIANLVQVHDRWGAEEQHTARLAAVEQAVADNQWLKDIHGVTRANDLRPRGYCTSCHDKHPCDPISLLEDIEDALVGLSVNHTRGPEHQEDDQEQG
jgi:hypothetical protein